MDAHSPRDLIVHLQDLPERGTPSHIPGATRLIGSIENPLHWVLDVAYREDESRIRINHGAENMGRLRRLTKKIIKLVPSPKKKMSIKRKRMMYGRDLDRVLQVLLPGAISEA